MDLTFPAEPARLSDARAALRQWLTDSAVAEDQAYGILVAADEACANAIEHGCRDRADGRVRLCATVVDGSLHLSVSDNGRWLPPAADPGDYRGRGLPLMRSLMDQVEVESGAAGTTVELRAELPGYERAHAGAVQDSAAR
ncbi:ATP-binding protein [Nocardia sp. NPDC048505]|uniref:ATP-binding protein n=1 Tax=unclassified Nocardia TaxID=2637762 RepID=UPI003403DA17